MYRAIRCLINGTLYLGCTIFGDDYCREASVIFNKAINPNPPEIKAMQGFFHGHFVQDIRILRSLLGDVQTDDVCMLLHRCIEKLDVAKEVGGSVNTASMQTIQMRDQWETNASKEGSMVEVLVADGLEDRIKEIAASFGASDDGNVEETSQFMTELNESFDVTSAPVDERLAKAQLLWVYRPAFSLNKFSGRLLNPEVAKQHSLLAEFVQVEPRMQGLRHLPAIVTTRPRSRAPRHRARRALRRAT